MRAEKILHRQLAGKLQHVHSTRRAGLFAAVGSAVKCGRITLTQIGRAIADKTSQKHGIKRVDRLLGNKHLHDERLAFYRAIASRIVAKDSRPVLLIDWTAVTPTLWALVAAVSFEGRALIVYAETHRIHSYMKPHVNRRFLVRLRSVLPRDCRPVVIADAGFRPPFMKLLDALKWDYVIRLRGPAKMRRAANPHWATLPRFFRLARSKARSLGPVVVGRSQYGSKYTTHVVISRKAVAHRKHHTRVRRGTDVEKQRRAAMEPWVLATSLNAKANKIVRFYERRMQIEETFRDTKSTRFGFCLSHARTTSEKRADILLLIAALAHLLCMLIGLTAEKNQLHRKFQANTARCRVVSCAMLGRLVVNSNARAMVRFGVPIADRLLAEIRQAAAG